MTLVPYAMSRLNCSLYALLHCCSADELLILEGPTFEAVGQAITMPWLPSASDFLSALDTIGCGRAESTQQQQQQEAAPGEASAAAGGRGGRKARGGAKGHDSEKENGHRKATQAAAGGSTAAAGPSSSSRSSEDMGFRDGPLRYLLQSLAHMCRLAAAGLVADLGAQPGLDLAKVLLQLHLDPRARVTCVCQLQEAFAAIVDGFQEEEWSELVGPQLVLVLAEPLGPSHRAAVKLLQELPGRSQRMQQLRQGAALQLVKQLTKRVEQVSLGGGAVAMCRSRSVP